MIKATDSSLYTGVTVDMERRWLEHNGTLANGAKYFRGRKPKSLLFLEELESRSLACKKESLIKKLSRKKKVDLIQSQENRIVPLLKKWPTLLALQEVVNFE